jgi:hypothetical protein
MLILAWRMGSRSGTVAKGRAVEEGAKMYQGMTVTYRLIFPRVWGGDSGNYLRWSLGDLETVFRATLDGPYYYRTIIKSTG